MNNLRNISLALQNYHAEYGSFPPAYTTDAGGTPLHSWRTLLLPYLDQPFLYERLRLDEPWDSPHNRSVTDQHDGLYIFACPSDESRSSRLNQTNYVAVLGAETMWTGSEARTLDDVTDGTSQTIMLVEIAESGIDILEPRDLSFDELSFLFNDPDRPSPSSRHGANLTWPWQTPQGTVNVVFVDGSATTLLPSTSPETLKALLTINGGETTEPIP